MMEDVKSCPGKERNKTTKGVEGCDRWRRLSRTCIFLMLAILLHWAPSGLASGPETAKGENVLRTTLKNGLRVVIVRNPLAPVVTTVVNYLVGSNEAPKGFPGTAHAQEHMMFRGSPGLSANQLADISAAMGGMFDADTQQTATQYFFTVPAEDLEVALRVEAIRMSGVLDSEALWKKERGAIEQEVAQDLSNPEYVFYTHLLANMFKGTPYAHDALGTRPSFDKTTGAVLRKFYDTWYAPNNAILVIVGDVQPEQARTAVEKLFGAIPSKLIPERTAINLQPVKPETLHLKTDLPHGLATISFRTPGYGSPDYAAAEVLAEVLSSKRGNLYALVPEGRALSAAFAMNPLPGAGIGFALAGFPKGANAPALIENIKRILTQDIATGFQADLVEAAKRNAMTETELQKNSVSGLAMAWSQALAVEGLQSPDDELKAIQQVSVEDLNRVAKQYLDLNHAIIAILTPEASGKPISSKGFGGRESFATHQTKPVKLPEWAEKALNRLTIPTSTVEAVVTTLPDGLKLIVQPEVVSNTVSVYGHIRNKPELEAPKGKEGVDEVLDQLFDFGTTSLDRLAFQKALDDIGANESAGTDFYLQVLSNHFERGLELLAEHELHPALPEAAFEVVRGQVGASLGGKLQSPDYLSQRALKTALFPKDDPTLRQATPETVSSLSLEDVRDYYHKVFRPDLTTIVVIGKITPEEARELIAKHFGPWKAEGPQPETLLPPVPPNKPSAASVPDASRVQDKVILAETLGITRTDPEYYALELGNHVLGGAFYATRLYRDLREQTGLVYYVNSTFEVGRTRALYLVEYGCDPPNVSKAVTIVVRDLKEMQNTLVTDDQLRQAQALLLRQIPLAESSVNTIAQGLIERSVHDLPLDEPIRAAHHYATLTAAQVRAAFAKWLRPGDLVHVTQGPNPR
jgi:zinc protease